MTVEIRRAVAQLTAFRLILTIAYLPLFSGTAAHGCDTAAAAAAAARRQAERDKEKCRQWRRTHSRQRGQTWAALALVTRVQRAGESSWLQRHRRTRHDAVVADPDAGDLPAGPWITVTNATVS